MDCLQCGKEATIQEQYEETSIRVCLDGHRTGVIKDELKESNVTKVRAA